ncbi:MAG: hypothetical protein ABMA15_10400 [Vicinamibacterales bacterium]
MTQTVGTLLLVGVGLIVAVLFRISWQIDALSERLAPDTDDDELIS